MALMLKCLLPLVHDMLVSRNQDPEIIEHQIDMLKQHGFVPKEKITKAIPLSKLEARG